MIIGYNICSIPIDYRYNNSSLKEIWREKWKLPLSFCLAKIIN